MTPIYIYAGGILLLTVIWIAKAIIARDTSDALKNNITWISETTDREGFEKTVSGNQISPSNLITQIAGTIRFYDRDGDLPDAASFRSRVESYLYTPGRLLIAAVYALALYLFLCENYMFAGYAMAASLIICLLNIYVSGIVRGISADISDVFIPALCPCGREKFNKRMSALNNVNSRLKEETKTARKTAENTAESSQKAKAAADSLDSIDETLKQLYTHEVETDKLSPYEALKMLNTSVDKLNHLYDAAGKDFEKQFGAYTNVFSRMKDIASVEKSVKDMSLSAVSKLETMEKSNNEITASIKDILEKNMEEFVSDAKFSFTNLNSTSGDIYDNVSKIFEKHVETADRLCAQSAEGFEKIRELTEKHCANTEKTLLQMAAVSRASEKAIAALCSANCILIDSVAAGDTEAGNNLRQILKGDTGISLSGHFNQISENMEKAEAAIKKLSGKGE